MPGSSHIVGLFACTNMRFITPDKNLTVTFNAEVVLATTTPLRVSRALLQHFCNPEAVRPIDGRVHFVSGKVASIDSNIESAPGVKVDDYDFFIDAEFLLPLPQHMRYPVKPTIVIAGAAGNKLSDRLFAIDVKNYVAGSQRVARHQCEFIAKGLRYNDKVPLPTVGKMVSISGSIMKVVPITVEGRSVKHIVVDIADITFLASDVASASSSNVVGKTAAFEWDTVDTLPLSTTEDDEPPPPSQPGSSKRRHA